MSKVKLMKIKCPFTGAGTAKKTSNRKGQPIEIGGQIALNLKNFKSTLIHS